MLSEIRDRATGWIAYIIVGIIIIPFAFWGVNQYFAGGEDVVVATVGDAEIQQNEYRRALDSRRRQLRQVMGENFNPELANSPAFKRRVLDDMIARALLNQHADEQGYQVGDQQLAEAIRSNPRFQQENDFSPEAYQSAVSQMGLTRTGFESRMRRQLVLDQIRSGVTSSSIVTPSEERRLLSLLVQKRTFDYSVMEPESYVDEQTVTDAEVEAEYDADSERYRTPERMQVRYVELSVDDLASAVYVTEEELRRAYERNKERFQTDPVRHASHILIETGSGANADEPEQALAKARDLIEQLKAGADFAELAREHSDDPGSASKGGDLGRVEEGVMVQPFEEALFDLDEEGEIAQEPVKSRFGYHIIKLTEYQPGETKPFEAVKEQLAEEERGRQAESLFLDRAEAFRNISYENPQSLEPVADQLDLKIKESDWFTRNEGDGIASNPEVREVAFSEDVYTEGLNSRAIELDINTLVVVRKHEVQPSTLKPLAEVRDEIEARVKRRKATAHVASLGPELVEKLNADTSWDSIISEQGLESRQVTWSRADQQSDQPAPPRALVDAVFRAPTPGGNQPVYGGLQLPDGGYALYALTNVLEGDPQDAPESVRSRVTSHLSQRRSQDMLEQYIADLRERMDVTVKEGAL